MALSGGGAAVAGSVGRRGSIEGLRRSAWATPSIERQAMLIPMTPARRPGSFAQRQRAWFNTAGLLRRAVARAQSPNGVTRYVRGERPVRFQGGFVGFLHALAFLRAARRVNPAPAHSRASGSANRSLDRAVQQQNGADAPDRSCDHGAEARGSF